MTKKIIGMPEYLNASYEGDDLYTGDQVRELISMLIQTEQEPVAIVQELMGGFAIPMKLGIGQEPKLKVRDKLYTTPPQRTWVGLTDEDKASFWTADQMTHEEWQQLFAEVEDKLKEKNT